MSRHVNFGWGQVLFWPRWTLAFYRGQKRLGAIGRIYRRVVYVWPLEVRIWK